MICEGRRIVFGMGQLYCYQGPSCSFSDSFSAWGNLYKVVVWGSGYSFALNGLFMTPLWFKHGMFPVGAYVETLFPNQLCFGRHWKHKEVGATWRKLAAEGIHLKVT